MIFKYLLLALSLLIAQSSAKDFTNSIGMTFKSIPAGSFMMGTKPQSCPKDDPFTKNDEYEDCVNSITSDELPYHKVTIESFYMASTEVTQMQYYKVMEENPSAFQTDKLGYNSQSNPVETVSWDDAQAFVKRLNELEGTDKYALPTESQWEYAARAGSMTTWSFDEKTDELGEYAWYTNNSGDETNPVSQKMSNKWGLYDMYGNVWEWCQDSYTDDYKAAPTNGMPYLDSSSTDRVIRGGSWNVEEVFARSADRDYYSQDGRMSFIGIRLIRRSN